jgi:membrane-bound lytic murein transglycosylase A
MRLWVLAGALMASALAGCVQPSGTLNPQASGEAAKSAMTLVPVSFSALPGWAEDHPAQALAPFLAGCAQMGEAPLGGSGDAASLGGTASAWQAACASGKSVRAGDDAAARRFFEAQFQPYAVQSDGKAEGLFTGYYEPEVRGSRSPGAGYNVALLTKPNDLVQVDLGAFSDDLRGKRISGRIQGNAFVPYYDRAAIEAGALRGRRLELLWLADPVDAFFLQIQGSGRVRLPDNKIARVTYAGQNGRPYVPIGRVLADRGQIPLDQVSMQSIRAWLDSHPTEAASVMDQNPSYVFFREVIGVRPDEGPPGAMGAPLAPGRSIAVDRSYIPLGTPVFIDTTDPVDGSKLQRLTVAQDIGGAIKGPVRADIFFGWGTDAETHAGKMRQQGHDYLLLPKAAPVG